MMQDSSQPNETQDAGVGTGTTPAEQVADERVEQAVQNLSSLGDEPADASEGTDDVPVAEVETLPDDAEPKDAEAEAAPEKKPLSMASDAARGAQESLRAGIAAFKSVREASQMHSSAREQLRSMQQELEDHTIILRHRIEVEQRYPQIVAEQTAELEEANNALLDANERAQAADAERADLESQLSIMKNRHEDELRPYRNVAESTRGRADDMARALADAKRATKSAEGSLAEATKRRDQRIAQANRTVDTAQERLRKLQSELDNAQNSEKSSPEAITRLQNELVSVTAHRDAAAADVPVVTEEMRVAVETAQTTLFDKRQAQTQAERNAEAAKKEANERRDEYDKLLKKAQEEERALSEQIKLRVTASEQAHKDASDAQTRINDAQEVLDDAEEIHATPQETIALREQVAREQADYDHQQDAVEELAENERELRRGTLKQRLILIAGIVLVIAIVIAVVVAIVMGGKS
jgi:uncharacterized membrane protein/predicted  nucleic acid-binding Zn-ribbon protein